MDIYFGHTTFSFKHVSRRKSSPGQFYHMYLPYVTLFVLPYVFGVVHQINSNISFLLMKWSNFNLEIQLNYLRKLYPEKFQIFYVECFFLVITGYEYSQLSNTGDLLLSDSNDDSLLSQFSDSENQWFLILHLFDLLCFINLV